MCSSYSLVPVVVAANVLPAIVGLNPAGVIRVVVDWTTKAEREEITVVESMMEVVVKVVIAPCRATVPTLNTSAIHRCCSHRTTADWTHISSLHHHGSRATSGGSGNARSSKTTAAPKTTATTESSTTSETSATSRVTIELRHERHVVLTIGALAGVERLIGNPNTAVVR